MILKILHFTIYESPLTVQALQSKSCLSYLAYLHRQLSHLNGRSLTTAKFKPPKFSVSVFVLSYAANMVILMILYDLCLLSAQFCYIIIYIRKVESRVQIADRCAPRKISSGAGNLVLRRFNFKRWVSAANSQVGQA
jgi:hypothetical protein